MSLSVLRGCDLNSITTKDTKEHEARRLVLEFSSTWRHTRRAHRPSRPLAPRIAPHCAEEVTDPLTCGDCSWLSVICRRCGTPLESPDELGIG